MKLCLTESVYIFFLVASTFLLVMSPGALSKLETISFIELPPSPSWLWMFESESSINKSKEVSTDFDGWRFILGNCSKAFTIKGIHPFSFDKFPRVFSSFSLILSSSSDTILPLLFRKCSKFNRWSSINPHNCFQVLNLKMLLGQTFHCPTHRIWNQNCENPNYELSTSLQPIFEDL